MQELSTTNESTQSFNGEDLRSAELLSDSLIQLAADIADNLDRRWQQRVELMESQSRAIIAELRADIMSLRTAQEQEFRARLSLLKDGAPGLAGSEGPPGPKGDKGDPGDAGPVGQSGTSGSDGNQGPPGVPGVAGKDGFDGAPGEPGHPGPPGQKGDKGDKGDKGERGDDGKMGAAGQDGRPGEMGLKGDQGERGERGEAGTPGQMGPPGSNGKDGRDGEKGPPGSVGDRGEKGDRGDQGLRGFDGEPGGQGAPGERGDRGDQGDRGERGEPGPEGPRGLLPALKTWRQDEITYRGEVVSYDGGCFQAVKDTAMVPGGKDWIMLAAAGTPGRSMRLRGLYREGEHYDELDVVSFERTWFVAKRDGAGVCPGPDWQGGPTGKKGDKGLPGERGPQGLQGQDGAPAREWVAVKVDRENYSLTAIMSDGSEGPSFSVRELFDQYDYERKGV